MPDIIVRPTTQKASKKDNSLDRIVLVFDPAKHADLHAAITSAAGDDDRDPNEFIVRYLAKQFRTDIGTFDIA